MKPLFSFMLILAGACLLFLGAREYLGSRLGQAEAARQFEQQPPETAAVSAPEPFTPPPIGDAFAKMIIPRLDAELYVVEGDGPKELRRGPGHMAGTAMPGAPGNCIIAGHRDTHFRILKDIRKGDDIVLQTRNGKFLYRVKNTRVISPRNTAPLQDTRDAELNLITCYPFYYVGSAPKRFVVEAQLAGAVATSASTAIYSRPHS